MLRDDLAVQERQLPEFVATDLPKVRDVGIAENRAVVWRGGRPVRGYG